MKDSGGLRVEAADEMPVQGLEVGELGLLRHGLLQTTFSETALAGRHRPAHQRRWLALADRQQTRAGGQDVAEGREPLLQTSGDGGRRIR